MAATAMLALTAASAGAQSNFGSVAVGTPATQPVVVASVTGSVTQVEVLTFGASGEDFAAGTGASTCLGASSGPCTESVTFTPAAPGLRMGAVVLLGSGNTVVGSSYISGTGLGGLGVMVPGNVTVAAGVLGFYSTVGDGQQATLANLDLPSGVTLDGAGNMYIADSAHDRVRMVCGAATTATIAGTTCNTAGVISTIAGNGQPGYSGDGGPAAKALLSSPGGVAVDGAGNLYIADTGNSVIRVISAATGTISTFAGLSPTATLCTVNSDPVGDNCPATEASLNLPWGVTLDGSGNVYIADTSDHLIREVSAATGVISTIAGTGYMQSNGDGGYNGDGIAADTARLNFPYAVAFDSQGDMYIADSANQRVREVMATGGVVTGNSLIQTFAGTGTQAAGPGPLICTALPEGQANQVELSWPEGVAVDPAGNVYIADTQNVGIRKVNPVTLGLTTVIQSTCGSTYVDSAFAPVNLYGPMGLYIDGSGNLYIADSLNMVVQEIQSNYVAVNETLTPVRQGSQSATTDQTVENDGNAALDLTDPAAGIDTALDPTATTCTSGSLGVDVDCTVGAIFAPAATPPLSMIQEPESGAITTVEDSQPSFLAPNNPLNIQVFGIAELVNATNTTVTSNQNPSAYQQAVTFTVTITTGRGTGNLTGTVSIEDTFNGNTVTLVPSLPVSGSGTTWTASYQTSTLLVGQHTIAAYYSGDAGHSVCTPTGNCATSLVQVVNNGTTTALTSSSNPSNVGDSVTFTAVVTSSPAGATLAGTVQFMDGSNALGGPIALSAGSGGQQAQFTTSDLTNGVHQITAVYSGDASTSVQGSTSAPLSQMVLAPTTVAVAANPASSNYGANVTFTATVNSTATSAPSGTVTFLAGGNPIGTGTVAGTPAVATFQTATLPVGTNPITVSYTGDGAYNAPSQSTAPLNFVVNQAQTATSVTAMPSPDIAGGQETLTAAVTVTAGVSTPTGAVNFYSNGTLIGSGPLSTTETASIATSALAAGTDNITAEYMGDTNDAVSTSAPVPLSVVLATTGVTVTASPSPGIIGQTLTFTATVTGNGGMPTGTVNFVANGNTIGAATLTNGTATITDSALTAGTYTVTANYLGDALDATSTSSSISETVGLVPTQTDLGSSSTTGSNPQVILVATVLNGVTATVPTGTVTFNNGNTAIGSATLDSSGVATLAPSLLAGTNYNLTAVYSGDTEHSPSTSQSISITGTNSSFNFTVTPASITLKTSENVSVAVSLSSNAGFTDTIGLGCASLPVGVTCIFTPNNVSLPANGIATSQLSIDTNNPLSGGATAMNRAPGGGRAYLAGFLLPFSAIFGWFFWRLRRRSAGLLTMVLVLAVSAGALLATGCNGFSQGSVKPGTYTIQVTGTGINSNITHYQDVTLVITQ